MGTGPVRRAGMRLGVAGEVRMRAEVAGEARWEAGRRRGSPRAGVWSHADLLFADRGAVIPVPVAVPQPSAQDNQ